MEPVDRIGGDLHGGVESERPLGQSHIVVDRLGNADDRHSPLEHLLRTREAALPSDDDQGVDPVPLEGPTHLLEASVAHEWGGPAGAENRSAARQNPPTALHGQLLERIVHEAGPAVVKSERPPTEFSLCAPNHATDDRIEAGAVATAGQDPDRFDGLYSHGCDPTGHRCGGSR